MNARKFFALTIVFLMVSVSMLSLIPTAGAASQNFTKNYRNDTDVAIPNGGAAVTSTINIPIDVTVSRIDVHAKYIHTRNGDLVVRVRSPTVGYQLLYWNPGDLGSNLDLTINDIAAFRNTGSLGVWTLQMWDQNLNLFSGNLDYWEIDLYYDLSSTITNPPSGTPISGTYTVQAQVGNEVKAELWMDGSYVSDMVYNSGINRYEYDLDTTAYTDGMHNLQVIAEDADGNRIADQMGVEVDNYDITANIVAPVTGSTVSGSITVWLNVPSYATWGSLSVDGNIVATSNTLINFGALWYFSFTLDTTAYPDGNHPVVGTAYDPEGNFASSAVNYDFDNYAISCSITDPTGGSSISATYTVDASVPATAVRGELFVDDSLYMVDLTRTGGEFNFPLDTTLFTDGTHNLKVTAYNAPGDTVSDAVTVIFDNWAITADIIWPATGNTVSGAVNVWVQVPSYASEGRLYVNNNLYQTTTTVQFGSWFVFNWDTTGVSDGLNNLRAEVDDQDGNTAVDSETPTVNNYAISVTITDPVDGGTISGTYTIRATVPSYAIRGELYIDDQLAGVDTTRNGLGQYTYSIDTTPFEDGGHTIRVVVFDPDDASAVDMISVTIDNYAITVNIQTPADGSTISGTAVVVRAQTQAYALKGELFIDGDYVAQDTLLDGLNRFVFQFDSTNYEDGPHDIVVRVYDPDGNWNSDSVSVTVDNWAISVTFLNPTDGDTISGTITVRASVPNYATRGDLLVDDTFYDRDTSVSGGEFTFSLDTTDFADGNHILRIAVYDPDDNFAIDTIGVTIDNYDISVLSLLPISGSTISGTSYNVWVLTENYATKGELYMDGQLIQTRTAFFFGNWYQFILDTEAFNDGVHSMSVSVYDPDGNSATETISVIVDNYQLTATITSPTTGSIVSGGVNVRVSTQDYAVLGECYLDDQLVDTDSVLSGTNFDFTIDSTMFKDSGHVIKVIVYDPEGTSAMDSISIIFDNWDISVNIFSPVDGSTVNNNINVLATVPTYATLGELYIDDLLFATDTSVSSNRFSFSVDTTNFADGLHTYKVKAFDPDGMFAIDTVTYDHGNYDLDVSIDSPNANDQVAGSISVVADVDDNANSAKLYIDSLLIASSTDSKTAGQSYTFNFDTRGFTDGNHIIKVEASYTVSGEISYDTIPITFDNTAPSLTSLSIIYLNGLTAVRAAGDKIVVVGQADDVTTGVDSVMLDATNIGGGGTLTMFDDGNHDDGESGDGVYGSDPIDVSGSMGYHRTFVTAKDQVGNQRTKSISVAIDDHSPLVTNTYILYPVGQSAAKLGDDVRVIANVIDTTVYVDIVLVIDTSGSMLGTPLSDAKKAAKNFVDKIDPNDRSALYSFDNPRGAGGNSPQQEIAFTTNKNNVKNKIDGLVANDWTPLYDTIWAATAYAKTSNNMPVVVVLTDGVDCLGLDGFGNCNVFSTRTIDEIQNASIPIFTIGLGDSDDINETALKGIAETSNGGGYYYAPDSDELGTIYDAIAAKVEDLEVGGISEVVADLIKVGSGTRNLMYDDGNHADGTMADNIFGSNLISAASLGTDKFDYWVNATDVGGNPASTKGEILIDNTPPSVANVTPAYPLNEWWVEDLDKIRFTADVIDIGNVGGIAAVWLDATNVGGSNTVKMRDDGTSGDTNAGDGVYTSNKVTISTGLKTAIMSVSVTAVDIAANTGSASGNIYVDNHRPLDMDLIDPTDGDFVEGRYTFRARTNNIDAVHELEINLLNKWYNMAYNAQTSYYELIYDTIDKSDGTYDAILQVTDIAGKTSLWTQTHKFSIDNNPPVLMLNFPGQGDILEGQVLVNTTGTTDMFLTTVEYKVDDLPWVDVSEPWNTTNFVDGTHTLEVKAMDGIGHETTRLIDVIIDNGNPEGFFVSPINGQYIEGMVIFQIKATDLVLIDSVKLTGAVQADMKFNGVTGYYEYEVDTLQMNDGSYAIGAVVEDIAGHTLNIPTITVHIDNNEPILTVINPLDGETVNDTVMVSVNVTDGPFDPVNIDWRVDNGPWQAIVNNTATWDTTNYQDGSHDLSFRTSDNLDRSAEILISVIVDNTAPTVELTTPINGQIIGGRYMFKMHAYDKVGVDRLILEIGGVNNYTLLNTAGSTYFEFEVDTTSITDGEYAITVTSYDVSGYTTTTSTMTIKIDNTFPELVVYNPTNGEYLTGTNYSIFGVAKDTFLTTVEYSVDGFGTRSINQTLDTTFLAEGLHTIEVIAKDEAGHSTVKTISVYVDNQGPSVSPISPQDGESVSGSYTFRIRAEDSNGIDTVVLIIGNKTLFMFQNALTGYYEVTRDTTLDDDGQSLYTFTATDRSGKAVNLTVNTRIDNAAPEVTIMGPGNKAKGIVKFRVQVSDPSGIDRVLIRVGGGDWRDMRHEEDDYIYRWKTTEEDNGNQPYDVKVVDKLGNEEIFGYDLVVNNPSTKADYTWLWLILVAILVVSLVLVALTSRPSASARSRSRDRTYSRRFDEEQEGPEAIPGRAVKIKQPRGSGSGTGPARDVRTPQHRAAMRKLESDEIVVDKPEEDEVEFMSMDGEAGHGDEQAFVVAPLKTVDDDEDDIEFLDDDEVSFHDDVEFHDDLAGEDEVSFHDDDEVSFHDDDVEFLDDDDDVEFLEDTPPPGPPAPPSPPSPRRMPSVGLTPRAQARPASRPSSGKDPKVSTGAIKGIEDLLVGGPTKTSPRPGPTPKSRASLKDKKKASDDPLGDLIGGI